MNKSEFIFFEKILLSKSYKVNDLIIDFHNIEFINDSAVYVDIKVTSQNDVCWSYDSLKSVAYDVIDEVIIMMGSISPGYPAINNVEIDGDALYPRGYYITEKKNKEIFNILKNLKKIYQNYDGFSLTFNTKLINFDYEMYDDRIFVNPVYEIPTIDYDKSGVIKTIKKLPQDVVDSLNEDYFMEGQTEDGDELYSQKSFIEEMIYQVLYKEFYLEINDIFVTLDFFTSKICGKKPNEFHSGNERYHDYFKNLDPKSIN
jgi:hypothetical protein